MQITEYVYVGFKSCGCIVAWSLDIPGMERDTAKDVAGFIRDGYAVQRMTCDQYRASTAPIWTRCPHGANRKAKQPTQRALITEDDIAEELKA